MIGRESFGATSAGPFDPSRAPKGRDLPSGGGNGSRMAEESTDLADVWVKAIGRIDETTVRPYQRAWLSLTRPVGLVEDTALLAAPNDFAKEWIETRLRPMIVKALSEELGREIAVAVTVSATDETTKSRRPVYDDDPSARPVTATPTTTTRRPASWMDRHRANRFDRSTTGSDRQRHNGPARPGLGQRSRPGVLAGRARRRP